MEVTVVKMRHQGEKLSPEQLEQAPRHHGLLEIHYWILENGRERRWIKELLLKPLASRPARALMKMTEPDQTQLKGSDMVYIGTETEDGQPYLQAWWVKLDPSKPDNGVRPYGDGISYESAGKRAT